MANISLLVYGSLINKNELIKENILLENCIPVKVNDLKREFTQEPTFRKIDSINRAVLSVKQNHKSFINAILINKVEKTHIENLDIRESGYYKFEVSLEKIDFKYTKNTIELDEVYVYMGKDEKRNEDILPHLDYLQLCLEGAKHWGDEFYKDFIKTTFVQNEALKLH